MTDLAGEISFLCVVDVGVAYRVTARARERLLAVPAAQGFLCLAVRLQQPRFLRRLLLGLLGRLCGRGADGGVQMELERVLDLALRLVLAVLLALLGSQVAVRHMAL